MDRVLGQDSFRGRNRRLGLLLAGALLLMYMIAVIGVIVLN